MCHKTANLLLIHLIIESVRNVTQGCQARPYSVRLDVAIQISVLLGVMVVIILLKFLYKSQNYNGNSSTFGL